MNVRYETTTHCFSPLSASYFFPPRNQKDTQSHMQRKSNATTNCVARQGTRSSPQAGEGHVLHTNECHRLRQPVSGTASRPADNANSSCSLSPSCAYFHHASSPDTGAAASRSRPPPRRPPPPPPHSPSSSSSSLRHPEPPPPRPRPPPFCPPLNPPLKPLPPPLPLKPGAEGRPRSP